MSGRLRSFPLLFGSAILVASVLSSATSSATDPHQVPKVDGDIRVDGVLDEPVWERALVLEIAVEVEPGENTPAPVRTLVLLCFSDSHLYAAFRAFDPNPAAIRARYADRDKLWDDDWVALVLDTFNDERRSFNFFVNPLGIQGDAIETATEGGGPEWDAIWDSAGRIDEEGYVVEIALPFSSLRFQPSGGEQTWGFDAVRSYPRLVTHRMGLFPRDRSNNCYLCQADKVRGFAGASPGRALEFNPTVSAVKSEERDPFPEGEFQGVQSTIEPGLTAHWGVTPNLNLSATINPDFSQIETDAAQLDVNTQFSLFYPEQRPFFLEGFDYFQTPLNAIYTRTLAEPAWGVKVAGKIGPSAIGFFSVRDDVTNLLFPATEWSSSTQWKEPSTGTVLRYRYDVGTSSTVGALITDREGNGYYNRLFGADLDLRFTPKDTLRLQVLESKTLYPEAISEEYDQPEDEFDGRAIDFLYTHQTRSYEIYGMYRQISPGFRADLGFVPQSGFKHYDTGYMRIWQQNDPKHWYNILRVWLGYEHDVDWNGNMLRSTPGTFVMYRGPLQSNLFGIFYYGKQTFLGQEYDDRTYDVQFNFQPTRNLILGLRVDGGDDIDYAHSRPGKRFRFSPSLELFAGRHLRLDLDHIYEHLDVEEGRLYTANLSELRTIYHFSRRVFFRLILQYSDHAFEEELYADGRDPVFKHLLTQWLFTYKVNPRTALYVGYTDNHQAESQISLTQLNRAAFFKISYAWVP
jgi:hypothetical protein